MGFRNATSNGQAQARVAATPGGAGLPEAFKNLLSLLQGDAGTLILNPDQMLPGLVHDTDRDHSANGAELHGVSHQVAQKLPQTPRLAPDLGFSMAFYVNLYTSISSPSLIQACDVFD